MNQPLISIIIPAYNAEKFLHETLDSVIVQTYQNWECIIINDGSTDDTKRIIKQYLNKDKRFIFIDKENEGVSKTRNKGIQISKGDFIAFLDSDDLWNKNHLEILYNGLIKNNADLVFSYACKIKDGTKSLQPVINVAEIQDINILNIQNTISLFLYGNRITTSFTLCKKGILQNNPFKLTKAEDYYLWLNLLLNNFSFHFENSPTGYYRFSNTSLSENDRNCTKEVLDVLSLLKKEIMSHDVNYFYYFSLWSRRLFLLKDSKKHYIEAINNINSIEKSYFSLLKKIAPIIPKTLLKIIALKELKCNETKK